MASSRLAGDARDAPVKETRRSIWSGALAGVGLVGLIDETVFHQLLHWHHFYDKSTLAAGLASDGLFHAGGFIAKVASLFLLADAHRRGGFVPNGGGALLLEAGGFQLYDGIVQHKLLGLHQIRYHVSLGPEVSHYARPGRPGRLVDRPTADAPGVPVQLECLCDRTCLGSRSALSDSPCCPP